MSKKEFKLSVRCFTYNQESFITQTLDGFCIQETNFPYLCCVLDDASTDGTSSRIRTYIADNFENVDNINHRETNYAVIDFCQHKINKNCFFVVFYLKYNHNKMWDKKENYIWEWSDSVSYFAICEGDDYWTDKLKLQKQVDFMDSNPDYSLCYTQCDYYYDVEKRFSKSPWGGPIECFDDFMRLNTVPTLTAVYRKSIEARYLRDVKPFGRNWRMGDYPRWIYHSHEGKVKFLPFVTGVYRVLASSASHSSNINTLIDFSKSSIDIRSFFESFFAYPQYTYVDKFALERRMLYLYALHHKYVEYFKLLFDNRKLFRNLKLLSYMRYFVRSKKKSEYI